MSNDFLDGKNRGNLEEMDKKDIKNSISYMLNTIDILKPYLSDESEKLIIDEINRRTNFLKGRENSE